MAYDRRTAYEILRRVEEDASYSNIEISAKLSSADADNESFVREIVYGVIKNRFLLDHIIGRLAAKGIKSVKTELLILLRMGIYQMDHMDSVPDYAAINETVALTKSLLRGKEGFVNGVLRAYLRRRDEISDLSDIKDSVRKLVIRYSCEEWIVRILADKYGMDDAEDYLRRANETPPMFIHVNPVKGTIDELEVSLQNEGIETERIAGRKDVLSVRGKGIISTKAFTEGRFFVQDLSSVTAISDLAPVKGDLIIDTCAAPGGKSFAMSGIMGNDGSVISMDRSRNKLDALKKGAERLGLSIISTEARDALEPNSEYLGKADKVLCDVPCTGLGVIRRKPEIKYRVVHDNGRKLAEKQLAILTASSGYVKSGGKLMYSTCTVNDIENSDVTTRFLSEHKGFVKVKEKEFGKEHDAGDGFYYCIMERVD